MKKTYAYTLAALLATVMAVSCNSGNNTSTQQDMDTNLSDSRRNSTDSINTLPDTARMKTDTFQEPSQGHNE